MTATRCRLAATRDRAGLLNPELRRLRRRCLAMVRRLPLPDPFDARELCRLVAQRRRRPISVVPATGGDHQVLGLWVATEHTDLIFYEEATTPPHQEHIILHELGHLLFDHFAETPSVTEQMRLLMPSLDPEVVRRVLGRTTYQETEEQEAELLATLIWERAFLARGSARRPDAVSDRIRETFDWPGRG
ncbi:ImmA/IrrE family metallo-endopeptidase [Amycolatopsis sp. YIM 10]|uniref:ImmA/IrrE family metallo-endopeptidase n=1 Tax=Amycolatopsis sp. YIM 10 TaxID=2653857 RepID=UPI00129065BA|nr:ImmA/IrrE family metallo-endopeptidase [Amycolatopsis sp. YIM 10]QFU87495.1 hypothetical protein YIM_11465 [Amycolatopsis sp. YIM 10]